MIRALLAVAIYLTTDATPHEAETLLMIARHESAFARDVVLCQRKGDNGRAHGAWQVHPRSAQEARDACDLERAPALALARVRESIAACGDLTRYVSGRCGVGKRAAKMRTPK
jgi:hypothetical protein